MAADSLRERLPAPREVNLAVAALDLEEVAVGWGGVGVGGAQQQREGVGGGGPRDISNP